MERVRNIALASLSLMRRSPMNGCVLHDLTTCTIIRQDSFQYKCTPKPHIEIDTLDKLRENVLDKDPTELRCGKLYIKFSGLDKYTISLTKLDLPQPHVSSSGDKGSTVQFTMSDSSEEKWCHGTTISYDLTRVITLIPGTVEDKFTLDPLPSNERILQLKIGDIKNTVKLALSEVEALTNKHLTLGQRALAQLQFIIIKDPWGDLDNLVIHEY